MWIKVAAGTSVVVVSLALVFYVSHLSPITISEVTVSGTNLVSADEVKQSVMAKLSGSYAYLIPHANTIFAPFSGIRDAVLSSFPPVATVSVSRNGWNALEISVTERESVALWCAGIPPGEISNDNNQASASASDTKNGCYLMDGDGFVFAPSAEDPSYVHYFGELSGNPIGKKYLDGGFASLQKTLKGIGESVHRTPTEALVDNKNQDVSIAFAEGGVVRFVRATDSVSTLQNIASVFASQNFKDHSDFEYVDFRFGDKVYVKFK